ncbi:hypothetical protein N802_02835 [Knoellia sinensis KCTC 19936]|uniref:Uncharacterized protein n=1 Tax=Knoellia sinensis KCTC 19936 TaxID=1385520 RepID=A0A0A0J7X2_9MICO|nr:T3SS effector HopA1 family protein [Knoellia sinensis]KGN31721.1 hypothetical protein N802_02835 [Knoellia sinensis KCTC 19936]
MSAWRPEHAAQLLTAYTVLRRSADGEPPAEVLYRQWYAVRSPAAIPFRPWDAPISAVARAAHGSASDWADADSVVVATGVAGVVVVAMPGGRRALCRGEYVTTSGRPGFPPRVGDRVRALRRLGASAQDGWWRTWGEGWDRRNVPDELDRVYLRVRAGKTASLVNVVTSALGHANSRSCAWLLKVAAIPDELTRADGCVLYVAGADRERVRAMVADRVTGLTQGSPPPLTETVADGVGWAEDPGTGESFGEVRCAAIAAAYERVLSARAPSDAVSADEWLDEVAQEFRRRAIQPRSPHRTTREAEVAT